VQSRPNSSGMRRERAGLDAAASVRRVPAAIAMTFFLVLILAGAKVRAADALVHEGVVRAPVEEVWRLFTTGPGMESWMVGRADIDLRIGGLIRTRYAADGLLGDDKTIVNRILSFEPERMLSIQVERPPADFRWKRSIANMWTVIYFQALEGGRTNVRIVGMGFDDTEESREMRAFFGAGNAWTLEQLQKKFTPDARSNGN
jgi:uncharacterized protein YndB with AHSA1/START domain